ncbi:MAG: type II toxin-antitoxin system VapC family toxin [Nitrososphaerales archaeon]
MKLFLDTGALVALHNKADEHHVEAQNLFAEISSGKLDVTKLYCSDYVLDESITTCYARTRSRAAAIQLGEAVLKSKSIVLLSLDTNTFNDTWRIFSEKFRNVPLSFTDCSTYVLAKTHSIPTVFTFDRDFDATGLSRIPR